MQQAVELFGQSRRILQVELTRKTDETRLAVGDDFDGQPMRFDRRALGRDVAGTLLYVARGVGWISQADSFDADRGEDVWGGGRTTGARNSLAA